MGTTSWMSAAMTAASCCARETSAAAIRKRLGSEPMSAEEFERHFGHLATDRAG